MTNYEVEWPREQHKQRVEVVTPRVCLVMSRFYPLFGGHIVQMMQFLPRLQRQGISAFVVTGMVEGDPQTKSVRDLLQGLKEDTAVNSRIIQLSRAVRAVIKSCGDTLRFIWQHPACFRRPAVTIRGIDIYRLPTWGPIQSIRSRFFSLSAAWYLIRNRNQYDVVHLVGTAWITTLSILLAKLLGKKTIVEMVLLGSDDPEAIVRSRFGKIKLAIWKRADRIASLSPALTQSCQRMNVAAEKVVVIPVGVDVHRFSPLYEETAVKRLREKLRLPQQGKLVIFVGGIMKRKGVDLLIDAWHLVMEKETNVHLVCIGPISFSANSRVFYEEQKQKIEMFNLQEAITFTGQIDNVEEYFQASDIFVLPSLTEGLPNSVLEAMACELPPVMSDIPGISRTIIRSSEEGIVFEERTPSSLATALLEFLQNDDQRAIVGRNARQRIIDAYSLTYRTEQYDTLYRTLITG